MSRNVDLLTGFKRLWKTKGANKSRSSAKDFGNLGDVAMVVGACLDMRSSIGGINAAY